MVDPQIPRLRHAGSPSPHDDATAARRSPAIPVAGRQGQPVGRAARSRIVLVTVAAVLATGLATAPALAHPHPPADDAATTTDGNSVVGQTAETSEAAGSDAETPDPGPNGDATTVDGAADEGAADEGAADEGAADEGAADGAGSTGTDPDSTSNQPGPAEDGSDSGAGEGEAEDEDRSDQPTEDNGPADDGAEPAEGAGSPEDGAIDPADAGNGEETDDTGEETDDTGENTAEETAEDTADEEPVDDAPSMPTETDEEGNPIITFPVVGPVNFVDTWGACRGSGCSRGHKGVDIFAHKLAPLVAAADGRISGDRRSAMGISGNTLVVTTDDGWRYLYIHINNDSPGTDDGANPQAWIVPNRLRVGDRVKAGDVIGYLGDSGNAETTPAHVHFEIHRPGEGAINPTQAVQSAQDSGRVVPVSSLASTADGRAEYAPTIAAWYRALLEREPTSEELFAWADRFHIGFATTDDLIADLTMAKPRRDAAGTIVRAFEVTLKRRPSLNEIRQWEKAYRGGADLELITKTLVESEPFLDLHGDLSDEEFVRVIYRKAVGVEPSAQRLEDWLTLFAEGSPRETLTAYWADSYSVKNSTWHDLEVIQSFRAALDRMPTDEEHAQWVGHLDAGGLIPDVVDAIRTG